MVDRHSSSPVSLPTARRPFVLIRNYNIENLASFELEIYVNQSVSQALTWIYSVP